MIINHNIAAMNTHRQLGSNNAQASKNLEKLSSGLKINKAGDDAAGLAISEKMRGQIRGLDMAQKNAQDGISLIQTAEGALNETHDILQRMRELAVQSSNDTNTSTDRKELQKELDQLSVEITRISTDTEFNTQKLLDGKFTDKTFHIGSNATQNLKVSVEAMDSQTLKVGSDFTVGTNGDTITHRLAGATTDQTATWADTSATVKVAGYYTGAAGAGDLVMAADAKLTAADTGKIGINISTQTNADSAITTINNAIETVSAERSKLGAVQNRLEHTINNLGTSSENLTQAESRIRDVDYVLSAA